MPVKDAVRTLQALAGPARLRIVLLLRRRELCVCELTFVLGMEQSRVSRHMRVLREAGLAQDAREGRWVVYRLPERARALVDGLAAGPLRDDVEGAAEASRDAIRLEACVRENVRGRVCAAAPGQEER